MVRKTRLYPTSHKAQSAKFRTRATAHFCRAASPSRLRQQQLSSKFIHSTLCGYTSSACEKGETKLLAVNFENVADATPIKVVDLVKAEGGFVGSTDSSLADQIWTYSRQEGWNKYYYYKKTRAPVAEYWAVVGGTSEIDANVSVGPGSSIFFVRSNGSSSSATTLTFAGGVVDLKTVKSVDVEKGETKLICNPWPIGMKISTFNNLFSSGTVVGSTDASLADQIWTYSRANGWKKYYYYKKTRAPVAEYWAVVGGTTEVTDVDTIDAGAGFFFVRSNSSSSAACTLAFKGPDYKGE